MPTPSLLQRLKERKIVQWGLAYLAGAFVVFQAVEVMAEPWGISPGFQRAIHVLLLIGLFITLVLAWYHGEKGRQTVSGPELLMLAALLVVAGVALTLLRPQEEAFSPVALEGDGRPGIAVFPCENWSPDPNDAWFASGIHDEILLRLSKISGLRSIGRETMDWYGQRSLPTTQVAQELGVGYLGECSVLKDAERNQVRLTFQLSDGNTGTQIWAENYDESLTARSIFDIHSDLAGRIARAIGAALTPEEQDRTNAPPTEDTEALNAYLLGRHFLNRRTEANGAENIRIALTYFEEALAADSSYALAWSGLSDALVLGMGPARAPLREEVLERAEQASRRAIAIDPSLPEGHTSLAQVLYEKWEWAEAEREYMRALGLSPNYPTAHQWYAGFLLGTGRVEDAIREILKAQEQDPVSPIIGVWVGLVLDAAGRTEEAGEQYERLLHIHPGDWRVIRELIVHNLRSGEFGQAADLLEPVVQGDEGFEHLPDNLRISETRASTIREMADWDRFRVPYGPDLAVMAGDKGYALELLERWSSDERVLHPNVLAAFVLDPELRREPIFRQLLEEAGVSW